ncbi:hotdog fold thioesterase [Janibacter cremeus]|uniref:PaaI family thioesterase n=1 Tax=Janibacter cremeus TaxID=1285192 RepID=UPI0023F760B1|nr:hotdog fold thioesterase [Janibacter cremeus]WEV79222.1 hotdog fold thioesterase [Janibacter cremeus]
MTETTGPAGATAFSLEALNAHRGSLGERMGIEILEAAPERVVARMPVEGNTQPYGLLHGGANVVLAETVGSIGSAMHGALSGKISVGLDINATHHRAARAGWVTATAVPVALGGTLTSYEITITDDGGRRTCTCRLTCLLRDQPPGS